ncbi:unnamed protein product [Parascedosporium putredinis]|uniref:Endocytosis protein 3 n=1 Tax=Parascedosporium putredinis TaxID=1442378 RepID=A0A9P1M748_9PEZI|nr:unnamed protein product [Parascedosporium putredinis]CAI7987821.1 unnamed protein product [Parascedosporium putredinis]
MILGGKFLTGEQAAPVLKNSGLRDDQLERVWDLADVDNDGNLDFEEFCVAMRLIFDVLNGEYADVPSTLPDWMVPESKSHLVQATRAITGKQVQFERVEDEPDSPGLKDGFDWYMKPADKSKYEQIYQESRDMRGEVSFNSFEDLYESLDVPDTDRNNIDYQVDNQRTTAASRWATKADDSTSTGRKAKFGEQYLTRLGHSGFKTAGTDFSTEKTEDWEEVRLKRQLQDLEEKIQKVESDVERKKGGKRDSKPALVKRELEQLLDYKRKQLRDLEEGNAQGSGGGSSLKSVSDDLQTIREQVDGLESHLQSRQSVLEQLRREIEDEKASR